MEDTNNKFRLRFLAGKLTPGQALAAVVEARHVNAAGGEADQIAANAFVLVHDGLF